jgi:peptidoglycan/xylan/chitin deacetylase (PgdA/CDA1 family)
MTRARPLLALKIDSDTLRGTREGVPRLAQLLSAAGAQATFLFSVGPDHTGRALRRILRPGFLNKVSRTSVIEHYGIRTLLYGTVLPGPHIGRSCAAELRAVKAAGFEIGLHAYDHVDWQDFVAKRDARWTANALQRGIDAFAEVFGAQPKVHGAAGWQMNDAAFLQIDDWGMAYASDGRGTGPYIPTVAGAPDSTTARTRAGLRRSCRRCAAAVQRACRFLRPCPRWTSSSA